MSNLKKLIFAIVILFLISVVFFVNYNSTPSYKIFGTVKTATEKSVTVLGRYDTSEKKPLEDITIGVSENTKIVKTSFVVPLPNGNEPFYVDKLPKEVSNVDIQTLMKDEKNVAIGIEIILKRNFFSKSIMAQEIKYTAPKY